MTVRRLKIAMLSVHSCPVKKLGGKDTGGMNVYVRELGREMGRRGHSVDVYTRAHDPEDSQVLQLGPNSRLIHIRAGDVAEMDKLAIYPHLLNFAYSMEEFKRCHKRRYDLIHSHYWMSGYVGSLIQRWWRIPHIMTFHTLGLVKNATGIGLDEPEFRIRVEKDLIKSCQHIVATTDKEKDQLIHFYDALPQMISIIPCGVNLDLFKPINKSLARRHLGFDIEHILLFVGRVVPLKGIERLLKAMTYLEAKELKLLIVGGDDYSRSELDRLKRLARRLRIHDSVSFLGSVNQEVLPYFYSAADVCILPSYYESFGMVALESLACGTPVVSTDVGGLKSFIKKGDTGYIVNDNIPYSLADKIFILLSKPVLDAKSIQASVTRFCWSNVAESILDGYHATLENFHNRVSSHTTN